LEAPLKNFSTSPEFGSLPHIEANLQSLADSHETTRQKSEKAKSKGKARKQEEKAREENDARALWETESPLILEKMHLWQCSKMRPSLRFMKDDGHRSCKTIKLLRRHQRRRLFQDLR